MPDKHQVRGHPEKTFDTESVEYHERLKVDVALWLQYVTV
jgi:hypothetical protein